MASRNRVKTILCVTIAAVNSSKRSGKFESKLSWVSYFLRPGEPNLAKFGMQEIADTAQFALRLAGSFAAAVCRYSYKKYGL